MRLFGSDRIAKLMDRMGLEEGEVIQHSMISKSIERAQRKVEENNFAMRKRLLEYDDVMNSQREVIYKRRKHALFGDRLQLDIMNMLYDTCEDITINAKAATDFNSLKLNVLSVLGLDYQISPEEFEQIKEEELSENLYNQGYDHYQKKNEAIATKSLPILKEIHKTRGATVQEVLVPFTDGKKQLGVAANLVKTLETEGHDLIRTMEKMITLALIDQAWKEHLRDMDDLKQSVQNAVYEQKDPLLIYKFEAFELFKVFLAGLNENTISFLMKAELPVQQPQEVQEAQQRARQNYSESKEESKSILSARGGGGDRPPAQKVEPAKSQKVMGRNDRVNVQYTDGRVLKNVKYKKVEEDIASNKCVIVED